jgi:hypothetical protein
MCVPTPRGPSSTRSCVRWCIEAVPRDLWRRVRSARDPIRAAFRSDQGGEVTLLEALERRDELSVAAGTACRNPKRRNFFEMFFMVSSSSLHIVHAPRHRARHTVRGTRNAEGRRKARHRGFVAARVGVVVDREARVRGAAVDAVGEEGEVRGGRAREVPCSGVRRAGGEAGVLAAEANGIALPANDHLPVPGLDARVHRDIHRGRLGVGRPAAATGIEIAEAGVTGAAAAAVVSPAAAAAPISGRTRTPGAAKAERTRRARNRTARAAPSRAGRGWRRVLRAIRACRRVRAADPSRVASRAPPRLPPRRRRGG